jgi:Chitobiase/beta-hexosaminidase C-terminal domain/Legume lectin domain
VSRHHFNFLILLRFSALLWLGVAGAQPAAVQMIGSLAPAGSPHLITDAAGNIWTVNGGVVNRNAAPVGVSSKVILLVENAGVFWQENNLCLWWRWNGSSWGKTGSTTGPAGVTLPTCTPESASTPPPVPPPSAGAVTQVFDYPNGFTAAVAAGELHLVWNSALRGSACNPAYSSTGHAAGACWYARQVSIANGFTTHFNFQIKPTGSPANPSITAFAFVIQNSVASEYPTLPNCIAYGNPICGPGASGDANMAGLGAYNYPTQYPIYSSVAIKFDLDPANGQWVTQAFAPNATAIGATGLYLNSGPLGALLPGLDMTASGINLYSGNPFTAAVTYDTQLLTLVLKDTVTGAQFRTSWPVNIPAVIGGSNAWIGFTGGIGPYVKSEQLITAWTFSMGVNPRLPAPTISPASGSYADAQTVTLGCPAGATCYYTTNGNAPTSSSIQYTGPFSVAANEVVQAVAVANQHTDSLVAAANYQVQAAGLPTINLPNGFTNAAGLVVRNGSAVFKGAKLQLTDTSLTNEAGSAWFPVPLNVASFHTSFTVQLESGQGSASGMGFCLQNIPTTTPTGNYQWISGGPNVVANSSGFGFSGNTNHAGGQGSWLQNSVCLKFDLSGTANSTGLYPSGLNPYANSVPIKGLDITSGSPVRVSLTYDGTTLSLAMAETGSKRSFTYSWPVNIPATVGGPTAYVGFTAGGYSSNQSVHSWTFGP